MFADHSQPPALIAVISWAPKRAYGYPKGMRAGGILLACVLGAGGCIQDDVSTPFEGDPTKPLTDPGAEGSDGQVGSSNCYRDTKTNKVHDEGYSDSGEASSYNYAESAGCIKRPIRETWAALNNQSNMVWDEVDEWSAKSVTPPDGVAISYDVHYFHDAGFDVNWDMEWHHSFKGTPENPEKVIINYQKVYGTDFIRYWKGSIVLEFVSDDVTSFFVRDEMDATSQDVDKNELSVGGIEDTAQHGSPDWSALDKLK